MSQPSDELFDDVVMLPRPEAKKLYHDLVGLDDLKDRLGKEARILLRPQDLSDWSTRNYGSVIALTDVMKDRLPLFVFAGDVGTGKTALAETFGDPVARALRIPVTRYRLSLTAR